MVARRRPRAAKVAALQQWEKPRRVFFGVELEPGTGAQFDAYTQLTSAWLSAPARGRRVRLQLVHEGVVMCSVVGASPGAKLCVKLDPGARVACVGTPGASLHLVGQQLRMPSLLEVAASQYSKGLPKLVRATPEEKERRTSRLSFNPEVLVATYSPRDSGISPARGTVPLDVMEQRAEQRAIDDVLLPLQPLVSPSAAAPPAAPAAGAPSGQPLLGKRGSERSSSPLAMTPPTPAPAARAPPSPLVATPPTPAVSAPGDQTAAKIAEPRAPLGSAVMAERMAALIASEESQGGQTKRGAPTDAAARGADAAEKRARQPAPAAILASAPDARSRLEAAAAALLDARNRLLRRGTGAAGAGDTDGPIGAAEAIGALEVQLGRWRSASRRARSTAPQQHADTRDPGLHGAVEECHVELCGVLDELGQMMSREKSSARRLARIVMGIDALYYKLVYAHLTKVERAPHLATRDGGDAMSLLASPAAFFRRAARADRIADAAANNDGCDPAYPKRAAAAAASNGRGWLARAVREHRRQLDAPPPRDNELLALWRCRMAEAAGVLAPATPARDYGSVEVGDGAERDDEPPAPDLAVRWRRADREWPCWMLAFAVPSEEALQLICKYSPLVEMGSGTGYWAKLLQERGADVAPIDVSPPAPGGGPRANSYHGDCPPFTDVRQGDASALAEPRWARHALFLCYPPQGSPMAEDALSAFSGDVVVHVGEWLADTARPNFERALAGGWELTARAPLPNWGDTIEDLTVWRRKPAKARATCHPVLGCDACGKPGTTREPPSCDAPGALRRCRFCRLAIFCSAACAKAGARAHARYHEIKLISLERELDFDGPDYATVCGPC